MEREIKSGGSARKKMIIAIILVVVAVGIGVGVYLWRKGRLTTGADVEQAQIAQDEQEFNAGDEEYPLPGNEYRVGNDKVALRSGTLVKLENAPDVYMIYRGTKRHIASPQVFSDLKLKWENVLVLPANHTDYLDLYENKVAVNKFNAKNLPDGLVVRFTDDPSVYAVINGKLKHYPSPSVFVSRHNWNEISVLGSESRQMSLDSTPFRYRGGNLVREANKPEVYWVAGAMKYHIDSSAEMEKWGLRWENIIVAEEGVLTAKNPALDQPFAGADMYAAGRNTSQFKTNFLPMYLWKNADNPMVYLFKYDDGGKDLQFISPQVFSNRFGWSEISTKHPDYRDVTF